MTLFANAIISENDHGYEAGRYVASHALAAFQTAPPSLLIAFVSDSYQRPDEVVRGIRSLAGSVPLIGSSTSLLLTMSGPVQKGVGVLALRSDKPVSLALEQGFAQQPAPALEQAMGQIQSEPEADETMLLVLSAGLASGATLNEGVRKLGTLAGPHSTLVGATSGRGIVFVNDEATTDGVALAAIRSSSPAGSCLWPHGASLSDTACQNLVPAGGTSAGLLFDSTSSLEPADKPEATAMDQLRGAIGRTIPCLGTTAHAVLASGTDGAMLHEQTVLAGALTRE